MGHHQPEGMLIQGDGSNRHYTIGSSRGEPILD